MSTKTSRIIYDRDTLLKIREDVLNNDEVYRSVKLKYQRSISNESQQKQYINYPRRRYTSFNSDETGNSEELGEWIDAGPRNNSAKGPSRGFNPAYRGGHRGSFAPRGRNWKTNFELEPLTDTGEENNQASGNPTFFRRNSKPPGLDPVKWFYIDLEGKERGPFPSPQMLEWFQAGFLSVSLKIRRSFDQCYRTIAHFFKNCNGGNPFEVNTLQFVAPILTEEEVPNPLSLPPDLGVNTAARSNNFWYYLSDVSTLQGPFSGVQMQEWLVKKLIYPTLKVRRVDQQNFYELASLIKIVPDAFTNNSLALDDLNSLLEASCIQQKSIHPIQGTGNVPNQAVQQSMNILQMSSANANNAKAQIMKTLENQEDMAKMESEFRAAQITDRRAVNDQIGNAVENRSKFWYYMVDNKVQGPFSGQEMDTWYKMNYFPESLPIRKGDKVKFQPLKEVLTSCPNLFDDERVFKFGDVPETQPIMKVSSPCALCHNDECEFRGLELTSIPSDSNQNHEVKNPCIRKPKYRCNHPEASTNRTTTLNDINRAHEVIIPTNPPLKMIRSFVKMRHCQEDDFEYTTISSIKSTNTTPPPIPSDLPPQLPHSEMGPKQTAAKIRHNHVNLNDSLMNNIQFVFGSPNKPTSATVDPVAAGQEDVETAPPPPPPVQPQNMPRKNSTAWSGDAAAKLTGRTPTVSESERMNVVEEPAVATQSAKNKKKRNSKKKGEESAEELVKSTPTPPVTATKEVEESVDIPSKPSVVNDVVDKAKKNNATNSQPVKGKQAKKQPTKKEQEEQPVVTENKKNKKDAKQEAWDAQFQKHITDQAQKIEQDLAEEKAMEEELRREEEENKTAMARAIKAKNAQIAKEQKEREKMEAQLSSITLPKKASWADSKPLSNGPPQKMSFAEIQAQQALETARQKEMTKQQIHTASKKSTWSNVASTTEKPPNGNVISQKVEIKFHESQPKATTKGPNVVNAKKPAPTVVQVKAEIPKKTEVPVVKATGKKGQPQQPQLSIWNISDPNAIKKAAKAVKPKVNEVKIEPAMVEPIQVSEYTTWRSKFYPEMPSALNKKRQDLISWCSKQMITLKEYTKIQSIDSETMATLLCDLDSKDDVSKFVQECFGKSKVCDKFVKDFSQKKDRLLKTS